MTPTSATSDWHSRYQDSERERAALADSLARVTQERDEALSTAAAMVDWRIRAKEVEARLARLVTALREIVDSPLRGGSFEQHARDVAVDALVALTSVVDR